MTVYNAVDIGPSSVNGGVQKAFAVQLTIVIPDPITVKIERKNIVVGYERRRDGPREQKALRVSGIARTEVTVTIYDPMVGQNMVTGDQVVENDF
jgi:hypothetical protein